VSEGLRAALAGPRHPRLTAASLTPKASTIWHGDQPLCLRCQAGHAGLLSSWLERLEINVWVCHVLNRTRVTCCQAWGCIVAGLFRAT
jgi:hypothetical protein